MFNIVLVEPEIPQNTGNIVRTAAATGCKVHLIKPLGFDISDKSLKRAGLDYWHLTDFCVYENLQDFFDKNAKGCFDIDKSYRLNDNGQDCSNMKSEDADKCGKSENCIKERRAPHFYFCSTKAQKRYDEVEYNAGDYLIFGKETKGLPEELLHANYDMTVRIPMVEQARSLNLSNSVAIVVYEGMRQAGFRNLLECGHLTKY